MGNQLGISRVVGEASDGSGGFRSTSGNNSSSSFPTAGHRGGVGRSLHAEQAALIQAEVARFVELLTVVNREAKDARETAAAEADVSPPTSSPCGAPREDLLYNETVRALLRPFEVVSLAGFQLGNEGLTRLSAPDLPSIMLLLPQNAWLRVLDLSFNELTQSIVAPLLRALHDLPLLTELKLSGNPLGSAIDIEVTAGISLVNDGGARRANDAAETGDGDGGTEPAASAAAQLGRWLSSNPPLEHLALFHCGLTDADVGALFSGLTDQRNQNLRSLHLGWNPACTSQCAQMALQLVTDLGNTTLSQLELTGAAPDTRVRLEYACTPEGVFPSGSTLLDDAARAPSSHLPSDRPGKKDQHGGSKETSQEQQRVRDVSLPVVRDGLSAAQASRFDGRCRYLQQELDGSRVLAPLTLQKLAAVLATRPPPKRDRRNVEDAAAAALDAHPSRLAPLSNGDEQEHVSGKAAAAAAVEAAFDDSVPSCGASRDDGGSEHPSKGDLCKGTLAAASREIPLQNSRDVGTTAPLDAFPSSVASHPPHLESSRPQTSPPLHLHAGTRVSLSSAGGASGSASRRRYAARTPQEMRDARFECPQRIAHVMTDAGTFRDRIHPPQCDPHAPPCAEDSRRRRAGCSSAPSGRPTSRAAWYGADGFVLRPNGFNNVLVAPVEPSGAAAAENVTLSDLLDRTLLPCWCTPRQTSSKAGMFAGSLHYHCVHEAAAADVEKPNRGASAAAAHTIKRSSPLPRLRGQTSPEHPPPLPSSPSPGRASPEPNISKTYSGCQGTGHICLSAVVANTEGTGGSRGRRERLRALLRTLTCPSRASSTMRVEDSGEDAPEYCRAMAEHGATSTHVQFVEAYCTAADSSNDSYGESYNDTRDDNKATKSLTGGAAKTIMMAAPTVHTTSGGVTVALNYNPLSHFTAPHVSCASGMALAEFRGKAKRL